MVPAWSAPDESLSAEEPLLLWQKRRKSKLCGLSHKLTAIRKRNVGAKRHTSCKQICIGGKALHHRLYLSGVRRLRGGAAFHLPGAGTEAPGLGTIPDFALHLFIWLFICILYHILL